MVTVERPAGTTRMIDSCGPPGASERNSDSASVVRIGTAALTALEPGQVDASGGNSDKGSLGRAAAPARTPLELCGEPLVTGRCDDIAFTSINRDRDRGHGPLARPYITRTMDILPCFARPIAARPSTSF
jgi:hypothetical protein